MFYAFKLNEGKTSGVYQDGEGFSGYDKLTWVERYDKPGEITIEAPFRSGLLDKLPLGTIVGHQNSYELMIIDTIKLEEKEDDEDRLVFEGPSLFGFLEERQVGVRRAQVADTQDDGYVTTNDTWDAIQDIINDHVCSFSVGGKMVLDADDALPGTVAKVSTTGTITGLPSDAERRTFKDKSLLSAVQELLKVSGLGLRVVRPNTNPNNPAHTDNLDKIQFLVHAGVDRSQTVIFSKQLGDFKDAKYLWSERLEKTATLSNSQYLTKVDHIVSAVGWFRKFMLCLCKDIDGHLDTIPAAGATRNTYISAMQARAKQEQAKAVVVDITQVDILPRARFKYRVDYDIGDIVAVQGNHGAFTKMRVVENADVLDKGVFTSIPSLELIEES